ncbi:MAG TPA: hypothetical protein PLF32_05745 [Bacteroidales bacterium]|nr:hypothetical protein [Bacteroidales bacterium]HOR82138.1 hypothetical protein [Bacteroidales bacterium]
MGNGKTIIILAVLLMSCNYNNMNNKNDFYSYSKIDRDDRIPLIEPYSISSDGKGKWIFQSEKMPLKRLSEWPVISVGIMDSANIVVNAWRLGSDSYKIWRIVNVPNDTVVEFRTEEEYLAYLKKINIDSVKLYTDFEAIYKEFDKENGTLPSEWVKYQLK